VMRRHTLNKRLEMTPPVASPFRKQTCLPVAAEAQVSFPNNPQDSAFVS
jgi:hypothetical protein